jgi:hypothetical protein
LFLVLLLHAHLVVFFLVALNLILALYHDFQLSLQDNTSTW